MILSTSSKSPPSPAHTHTHSPPPHTPNAHAQHVKWPLSADCLRLSSAIAGAALQVAAACLRSAGGSSLLPAAAQQTLRLPFIPAGSLAGVRSSHSSWQYGGAAQPWAQPGSHAFHCFRAPQSPAHQLEDESQRKRRPSGHRRHRRGRLHTSVRSRPCAAPNPRHRSAPSSQ